jgi:hypothetical protein
LKRLPGWRSALFAAIEAHRRCPLDYGTHDCALLAADSVLAMTGVDLAARFRGRYASEAEARALLAAEGFADVADVAAAHFETTTTLRARVGDLAALPSAAADSELVLGVVTGSVVQVFAPQGVGAVSLRRAIRAYRVGD